MIKNPIFKQKWYTTEVIHGRGFPARGVNCPGGGGEDRPLSKRVLEIFEVNFFVKGSFLREKRRFLSDFFEVMPQIFYFFLIFPIFDV